MEQTFNVTAKLNPTITVQLTEREAIALSALTVYGIDAFLKVHYSQMGKHDLQPVEEDFKKLFERIKTMSGQLALFRDLRTNVAKRIQEFKVDVKM